MWGVRQWTQVVAWGAEAAPPRSMETQWTASPASEAPLKRPSFAQLSGGAADGSLHTWCMRNGTRHWALGPTWSCACFSCASRDATLSKGILNAK